MCLILSIESGLVIIVKNEALLKKYTRHSLVFFFKTESLLLTTFCGSAALQQKTFTFFLPYYMRSQ